MYIILAILIFGVLIATHEFGHFAAAKLSDVKVNEFSIGMGPAVFKKQKGETLYSIRLLPVGGFCAMEGEDEDEESADPRSFHKADRLHQFAILVSGAAMNFVTGLLLISLLYAGSAGFIRPTFLNYIEGYGLEDCGLLPGDIFVELDGHRIYTYGDLSVYLGRADGTIDYVVERNGEKIRVDDVHMPLQERVDEEGNTTMLRGFYVGQEIVPATFFTRIQYTWYTAVNFVRTVWMSLGDLIGGVYGLRDLSGPVGIVDTMSQIGEQSESAGDALSDLTYLAAFIAINLAVMNLMPLPALDGGRIFFLLLNAVLPRKIPAKYEGYVHMAGMALLMALMVVVTLSDVGKLVGA